MSLRFRRLLIALVLLALLVIVIPVAQGDRPFSVFLPLLRRPPPNGYLPLIAKYAPTPTVMPTATPPPVWINLNGGSIVSLAANTSQQGEVYAAVSGAGIGKSTDGGETWQIFNKGLATLSINAVAIDPLEPNRLYAGTQRAGIFRSTDGGYTWQAINKGIQAEAVVYSIAIDPLDPSRIYIGTRGISNNGGAPWRGVMYKSVDYGENWYPVLENVGGSGQQDWIYSISIVALNRSLVFAASHEHGPYLSRDWGETWQPVGTGLDDLSGRAVVVDPRTVDPITVYYGTWHRSGVYKTINSGSNWAKYYIEGLKVFSMAIDLLSPDTVYMATFDGHGVMQSRTAGASWNKVGLTLDSVYTVAVDPFDSSRILAGTAGDGLWISRNGGLKWYHPSQGLAAAEVSGLLAMPGSPGMLVGSVYGGGIQVSSDNGAQWDALLPDGPAQFTSGLVADPNRPGWMFALTDHSGLLHLDLSGAYQAAQGLPNAPAVGLTTSQPVYLPALDPSHPYASPFALQSPGESSASLAAGTTVQADLPLPVLSLAFAPSDSQVAYAAISGAGVYHSADGGENWQSAGKVGGVIASLAVDPANPNHVAAAGPAGGGVFLSDDSGASWTETSLGSLEPIYGLAFRQGGALYAATAGGVWRMEGNAWVQSGLSGQVVTLVTADPLRPAMLYAGTTNGAYISSDGGFNWQPGPSELTGLTIRSIQFDPNQPGRVYYGTLNHGALRDQ